MSNIIKTENNLNSEIQFDLKISTEDVVAIGVSQKIELIETKRKQLIEKKKELDKTKGNLEIVISNYVLENFRDAVHVDKIRKSTFSKFKKHFPKSTITENDIYVSIDLTKYEYQVYLSTTNSKQLIDLIAFPVSKVNQFKKLNENLNTFSAEINQITSSLLELSQEMANIPNFERTCRAQIAKHKLGLMKGGDDLIQKLETISQNKKLLN